MPQHNLSIFYVAHVYLPKDSARMAPFLSCSPHCIISHSVELAVVVDVFVQNVRGGQLPAVNRREQLRILWRRRVFCLNGLLKLLNLPQWPIIHFRCKFLFFGQ